MQTYHHVPLSKHSQIIHRQLTTSQFPHSFFSIQTRYQNQFQKNYLFEFLQFHNSTFLQELGALGLRFCYVCRALKKWNRKYRKIKHPKSFFCCFWSANRIIHRRNQYNFYWKLNLINSIFAFEWKKLSVAKKSPVFGVYEWSRNCWK